MNERQRKNSSSSKVVGMCVNSQSFPYFHNQKAVGIVRKLKKFSIISIAKRRGLVRKPERFSINPHLYISKTGSETIG